MPQDTNKVFSIKNTASQLTNKETTIIHLGMKKIAFSLLIAIIAFNTYAQDISATKVFLIDPSKTAEAIQTVHGPHVAIYNKAVTSTHKLFLMIVGTGGFATETRGMDSIIAGMGYHAISIDYKNTVITTVCNNSPDSACFDKFRQEIMFGTPVSDSVNVDSANCIINRVQKLLLYLVKNDPSGGWGEFIKKNDIQWGKIVVGGHSQGAGHSAFIAQHFKVSRALIFSGPQDYRVAFHSPALWLSRKSVTPPSKYFAFLHINDPYDVTRQLANCSTLMHTPMPDSISVKPGVPIITSKHILVNDISKGDPHMSTLLPEFKNVWEYMLNADIAK